jgi:thioredoxin 2
MDDRPVCGKCRALLAVIASSGIPLDITDNSFENEVLAFNGPVLMDCWAPWCGPCRMLSPVIEQIAKDYRGRLKVVKLNTDENPKIAMKFNIQSIPTMLLFNKGAQVDRMTGALSRQEIEKRIATVL